MGLQLRPRKISIVPPDRPIEVPSNAKLEWQSDETERQASEGKRSSIVWTFTRCPTRDYERSAQQSEYVSSLSPASILPRVVGRRVRSGEQDTDATAEPGQPRNAFASVAAHEPGAPKAVIHA
jgi:hypothetical protein